MRQASFAAKFVARTARPATIAPQVSAVRRARVPAAHFVARKARSAAIAPQVSAAVPARSAKARSARLKYRNPASRAPARKGPRGDPIAGCGPGPCGRHPKLGSRSAPNRQSVRARTKGSPVDHRVAWIPGLRADKWGGANLSLGGQSRRVRERPAFTARTKAQAAASRPWPGRP